MSTDWSARTAALDYFEKKLRYSRRTNTDDRESEMYEQAVNALRRSQDHTAIQSKLNRTIQALKVYTNCRHACTDCFCTKEARAELSESKQ